MKLENLSTLDFNKILFSKPEVNKIPGQKLTYQRIRINVQDESGLNDLIIASPPNLMCWGLQENRDLSTNELTGYQLPIVLWSKNGPTDEELEFTNKFKELCNFIKNYLVEHRDEFGKYDLDLNDLKKFDPLYWKMEKGKILENKGPTLYAKCLYDRKKEKINTIFVNDETKSQANPLSLLGKRKDIQFALKIEAIYIGTKISFQIKLYEVKYKLLDTSMKSLLTDFVYPSQTPQIEVSLGGKNNQNFPKEINETNETNETKKKSVKKIKK